MIENIILSSIILIAVVVSLAFLTKATGKTIITDKTGFYSLRMNKFYGIAGLLGLGIGLVFSIFLLLTEDSNDSGVIVGLILVPLIFWGSGIPCLMYYRNHRLSFNNKIIRVINVYGNQREIQWQDILDIKFQVMSGLLILKTADKVIKVHQHLVGLSKFMEYIESKTRWDRKELRVPIGKLKITP